MITGIILASGFSRRFKSDKLTYKISNRPLVEHVVINCLDSKLDEVIVVYRKNEIFECLKNYDVKLVKNENAEAGMSESLKKGAENAHVDSKGYMIFMGDQILFDSDDIDMMLDEFENHRIIIAASYGGKRMTPVLFPACYRDEILKLSGDEGGRSILANKDNDRIYVEYDSEKSIDIDEVEDVDRIQKILNKDKLE